MLSVRSALLSVMLGAAPDAAPVAQLIRGGALFGFSENAVRVALTRCVASSDLARSEEGYVLGERLLKRQRRQQEAVDAHPSPWSGTWEAATSVVTGRSNTQRVALRTLLGEHRLAELREGLWMRPANLTRPREYADHPDVLAFEATHDDPVAVARRLWDLDTWSTAGTQLLEHFHTTVEPAARLSASAAIVRHLATDPILPVALLPEPWPGEDLRRVYAEYQRELRDLAARA